MSWVREQAEGDQRAAGMGVRFLALDDSSRELVDKMVTNYAAEGGKPFDLDADASVGTPPQAEPPPAPTPVAPPATRAPQTPAAFG